MASGSRPSSDQRSSAPGKRRKIMVESVKEFNLPMIDGSCPPSTGLLNVSSCFEFNHANEHSRKFGSFRPLDKQRFFF